MHNSLIIKPLLSAPVIKPGDDLASILISAMQKDGIKPAQYDIICMASKVVSIAENRLISLDKLEPSAVAHKLHKKIPRKDPRILQIILDEVNNDISKIRISGQWIGAKTKYGRILTSAGIDSLDDNTVLLLPVDPDNSAKQIGERLAEYFGITIGLVITDSDGREDIAGATQICIGSYGVPPLRKQSGNEETVCDMLAAAAGLVMGQRGNNVPVVVISGFNFKFKESVRLSDAY